MKTIDIIVGTVPEAVKLGPVCRELLRCEASIRTRVILSGQHIGRVQPILRLFGVRAHEDHSRRIDRKDLSTLATGILKWIARTLRRDRPVLVVVQGDTITALMGALAAFYERIPVAHVEAGLTTGDVARPFPEELNRNVISKLATLLFAPSMRAAMHARKIARPGAKVFMTGNPCVDSLIEFRNGRMGNGRSRSGRTSRRRVLVTVHRRENFNCQGENIGRAISNLAAERTDAEFVFVGHTHPALSSMHDLLQQSKHVTMLPPQGYPEWLHLLSTCYFVLSDSGGAQEEAPWLRKPLLVLRDETERPEVIDAGAAKLVGSDPARIYESAVELLDDREAYRRMLLKRRDYPYGRGRAARRIVQCIAEWLEGK